LGLISIDLAERKLEEDLTSFIDDLEIAPKPVHIGVRLRFHQVARRGPGSLPGLIGITKIGA
jgi:hypothetical protein